MTEKTGIQLTFAEGDTAQTPLGEWGEKAWSQQRRKQELDE